MEDELIKYREIQRVALNSENLHNEIARLEFKRRNKEISICEEKQKILDRVDSNKMIVCTEDNIQLADEAYKYISNKIKGFKILLYEDKRVEERLKENKYNFARANQN